MKRQFLEQRLYPKLQLGATLTVARGDTHTLIHARQGLWDGACGYFCIAMALAIMGRIGNIAKLCDRKSGVSGKIWKAARSNFFDGTLVTELVATINSLDAGLQVDQIDAGHRACLAFTLSALAKQRLVIVGWRERSSQDEHWVICDGVEGLRTGRDFAPHTLLCIDPSVSEPLLCGYNARLRFAQIKPSQHSPYVPYISLDGHALSVQLTAAVSIGEPK